jgi:hypothetical protein
MKATSKETKKNNRRTKLSPLAQERLHTAAELPTSSDDEEPENGFGVFRRIHFFRDHKDMQTVLALNRIMATSLSAKARSTAGFIYMFHYLESPSVIHIGMTSVNPGHRIREWKARCGLSVVQVMDVLNRQVPNLTRLRHLIHLNLTSTLRRRLCQGCGRIHGNEFEISEQLAFTTIERWRRWMDTEPYNGRGALKPYWERQIMGLNSPLTLEDLYVVLERA